MAARMMCTMYFRIAASRLLEPLAGTFIQSGPQRQRLTTLGRLGSATDGGAQFDTQRVSVCVSCALHTGSGDWSGELSPVIPVFARPTALVGSYRVLSRTSVPRARRSTEQRQR